jgi:hypothetical protein
MANRGTELPSTPLPCTISGATSDNYSLMQPCDFGRHNSKALLVTGLTGDDKTYDGNTRATALEYQFYQVCI